jgi:carboxypeptidase PM20D1
MEKINRFCDAIKIDTSWPKDALFGDKASEAPLTRFQEFLLSSYPAFCKTAEHWILNPYAIIFCWKGASSKEKPILFTAHYDVVPVEEEKWTCAPFGAEQKDGFIYEIGRAHV